MFERVGRPLDPDWPVRQAVAVWLFLVVLQCAGSVWGAITVVVWLVRALWSLLQWLLALWFAITVPDLELLLVPEVPEALDIVEVDLDGGWEELADGWDQQAGLEALPDRPLPSLEPAPPPQYDVLVPDELESVMLLRLIGTRGGEDTVVSDLFTGVVDIDDAADDVAVMGVLGALSSDDAAMLDVLHSSGVTLDLSGDIGGLIGNVDTEIGVGGLGMRGSGLGGGGSAEGLGRIVTIGHGSGSGLGGGVSGGLLGGEPNDAEAPRLVRRAEVAWPGDEPQRCVVRVRVDADGAASVERFLNCPEGARGAVEEAVAASRFRPAERDGEPVSGAMTVTWR